MEFIQCRGDTYQWNQKVQSKCDKKPWENYWMWLTLIPITRYQEILWEFEWGLRAGITIQRRLVWLWEKCVKFNGKLKGLLRVWGYRWKCIKMLHGWELCNEL